MEHHCGWTWRHSFSTSVDKECVRFNSGLSAIYKGWLLCSVLAASNFARWAHGVQRTDHGMCDTPTCGSSHIAKRPGLDNVPGWAMAMISSVASSWRSLCFLCAKGGKSYSPLPLALSHMRACPLERVSEGSCLFFSCHCTSVYTSHPNTHSARISHTCRSGV